MSSDEPQGPASPPNDQIFEFVDLNADYEPRQPEPDSDHEPRQLEPSPELGSDSGARRRRTRSQTLDPEATRRVTRSESRGVKRDRGLV